MILSAKAKSQGRLPGKISPGGPVERVCSAGEHAIGDRVSNVFVIIIRIVVDAAPQPARRDKGIAQRRRPLVLLGRLLVRNIAMSFDAYLGSPLGNKATRFSRTV